VIEPRLVFDPDSHTYTLDGVAVPSVTAVLSNNRQLVDDRWFTEFARDRGTAVHLATALHDRGLLDRNSVDDVVRPYLNAWLKFKDDVGFTPRMIEQTLYNERYQYAGTVDRIGDLGVTLSVLDIKTGTAINEKAVRYQTAAYLDAAPQEYAGAMRYCVQLKDNGKYKLHGPYMDINDFAAFVANLTAYRTAQ